MCMSASDLQHIHFIVQEGFDSTDNIFIFDIPLQWYYFFCFQNTSPSKYATPLKWAVTEPGKSFLMSGKWASDVAIAAKLYKGNAGRWIALGER